MRPGPLSVTAAFALAACPGQLHAQDPHSRDGLINAVRAVLDTSISKAWNSEVSDTDRATFAREHIRCDAEKQNCRLVEPRGVLTIRIRTYTPDSATVVVGLYATQEKADRSGTFVAEHTLTYRLIFADRKWKVVELRAVTG